MMYIVAVAESWVTRSTAAAGPIMKDSSTVIESMAYAGRRDAAGTRAAIDCRTTENTGIVSSPSSAAATSSATYGSSGATDQNAASATMLTASAARRDRRSV